MNRFMGNSQSLRISCFTINSLNPLANCELFVWSPEDCCVLALLDSKDSLKLNVLEEFEALFVGSDGIAKSGLLLPRLGV